MSDEIEEIKKRLQAVENAISELHGKQFATMRMMSVESCELHYHVNLLFQKGEEVDKFAKIWLKRLRDTTQEIDNSNTIDGLIKARDKFVTDISDYVRAAKVDTADKAMEIAHSLIKKYVPVALPLKAERKGNEWLVDIDVGALAVKIAKVKVDARTGDILSYEIPEKGIKKS